MSKLTTTNSIHTAGQVFHGYKRVDGKYEDLFGYEFQFPPGVAVTMSDGAWYEVDFNLPEIEGVSSKAIFTGWNGYARRWNAILGSSGSFVQIAQAAWFYKSVDGKPWVLWVDTSTWKIKAHEVTTPEAYYPSASETHYIVGEIPAMNNVGDMGPVYQAGYNFSCAWVNQSKTGRRAAIHRYSKDANGFNMPSSIVEVIVGDNGGASVPFVDVATYTKGCVRDEKIMPTTWYWDIYVSEGVSRDHITYSYVIVYDDNESPKTLQYISMTDAVDTVTIVSMDNRKIMHSGTMESKDVFAINGTPVADLGAHRIDSFSNYLWSGGGLEVISSYTYNSGVFDRVIPIHGCALIAVPRTDATATEYIMPNYTSTSPTPVEVRGFLTGKKAKYNSFIPVNITFSNMCIDYSGELNASITRRF